MPARHAGELARGAYQLVDDAGLRHGVAGVADDPQLCLRPRAPQVPGVLHRGYHVIATVHHDAGQMADALDPAQELVVALEETAVDEVVAFDAGESDGVRVSPEEPHALWILHQGQRASLPHRPGP